MKTSNENEFPYYITHTLAILGFSNGGFPNGPSMVGLLMLSIHFLNN